MDTLRKELKDAAEQYLFRINEGRIFGAEFMRGDIKAAFEAGYHEAEKDLALTWEDMRSLHIIFDAIDVDIELGASDINKETIGYYKEALRRFRKYKQSK